MKHTGWLVLIILVGFLLRTYPYAHYPHLLTNDAMRDFAQVQYLQENQMVNWGHAYGRNPTLHLVVCLVSVLGGVDAWFVDLFVPQLVSSLGILFFYLFLRGHVGGKVALVSSFFLAAFGPNIWWGAQAVRETIGLFYFPFVLYAFDRFANGRGLFVLAVSFLMTLVTHNWTTVIVVGTVGVLALVRYQNGRALVVAGISAVLMFLYWKLKFVWYYKWVVGGLKWSPVVLVGLVVLYLVGKWCRSKDVTRVGTGKFSVTWVVGYIVVFFFAVSYLRRMLVFAYPPQEYLSVFLLGLFFALGVGRMDRAHVPMLMLNVPLLVLVIIGLYLGTYPDFDAARVVEYLAYPNAVIAAIGFSVISGNKTAKSLFAIVIILGGLLIYPPVFVIGKQISQDSMFYDVRSHIRYIPDDGRDIMKWGHENNYTILSVNPNFNDLRGVVYPVDGRMAFLVSEYDYGVLEAMGRVRIRSLGMGSPEGVIDASKSASEIHGNGWGTVYEWNENVTMEMVVGEYVDHLRTR